MRAGAGWAVGRIVDNRKKYRGGGQSTVYVTSCLPGSLWSSSKLGEERTEAVRYGAVEYVSTTTVVYAARVSLV